MAFLTHRPAAGGITEAFGPRPKPTPTSPAIHYGIDYGWGGGDAIFAARAGRVKSYGRQPGFEAYGNRLVIDHGDGSETWYCHLSRAHVGPGDYVQGGQHIGEMGATGNVTAKHLHFELRIDGRAVDPAPYFTTTAGGSLTPIGEDDMEYKDWSHESKLMLRRDIWGDSLDGGIPNAQGDLVGARDMLAGAEQAAKWAADQTAPGIDGVRKDGPLAKLVREGVTAAQRAGTGADPGELAKLIVAEFFDQLRKLQ